MRSRCGPGETMVQSVIGVASAKFGCKVCDHLPRSRIVVRCRIPVRPCKRTCKTSGFMRHLDTVLLTAGHRHSAIADGPDEPMEEPVHIPSPRLRRELCHHPGLDLGRLLHDHGVRGIIQAPSIQERLNVYHIRLNVPALARRVCFCTCLRRIQRCVDFRAVHCSVLHAIEQGGVPHGPDEAVEQPVHIPRAWLWRKVRHNFHLKLWLQL
mmetsp:Transcript_2155/g.4911  ORF Transcript_2155/g.4911 Transcript_2155/m.4911 type:complete len:210 (+) Transcript_2155:898-1527(+)